MAIWRVAILCYIPAATNIHSEYVILTDFPLQKLLQECGSMLVTLALPVLLVTTSKVAGLKVLIFLIFNYH